MKAKEKIWIAGRSGLAGSAIERKLRKEGYQNIIGCSSQELDLRNQSNVEDYVRKEKPQYIILAAAKVGGIAANIKSPADFLFDNISIQSNVIHYAYVYQVKKLLFLGSSCIYPRECVQPMTEEDLFTGKPEPTNEAYAIAKLAGLRMCDFYNKQYGTKFINVIPCNLYGIGDKFDLERGHVVAALIKKIHEAREKGEQKVEVWGSGNARRELMYSEDFADACYNLLQNYHKTTPINIGTGKDYSIKELATIIKKITGYNGRIYFNQSKPEGMPQKVLNIKKISQLGWNAKTELEEGLYLTYKHYLNIIN